MLVIVVPNSIPKVHSQDELFDVLSPLRSPVRPNCYASGTNRKDTIALIVDEDLAPCCP